jgi:hypothetical protein
MMIFQLGINNRSNEGDVKRLLWRSLISCARKHRLINGVTLVCSDLITHVFPRLKLTYDLGECI